MLKAKSLMPLAAMAGAGLLAACTTTGNVERNAAGGAALGALAGAVIGNNVGGGDAGTGAAIGAAIGGARVPPGRRLRGRSAQSPPVLRRARRPLLLLRLRQRPLLLGRRQPALKRAAEGLTGENGAVGYAGRPFHFCRTSSWDRG